MSESASVCVLYQQQIAAALAQLRFNSALTVQLRDGDCDSDGDDDCCCARSMCLHWMWQRERESVFTAALRLHWTSRKRESSCSLQFVSHRKKIFSTLRRTTIALFLSHSLHILFCSLCLMLFLLFVVFVYFFSFCLLLSAPLPRCCCCFFFFFYIVTNTQKQLKNNNIKKYRNRRTCWLLL